MRLNTNPDRVNYITDIKIFLEVSQNKSFKLHSSFINTTTIKISIVKKVETKRWSAQPIVTRNVYYYSKRTVNHNYIFTVI